MIISNGRPLRDLTRDALLALEAANRPPQVFVRGGELVRVRRDEYGRPMMEVLAEAALRGHLTRAATFVRVKTDGTPVHVPPPLNVVRDVTALGDWPFPPLAGITGAPVLRPDGTILAQPGYDPRTRLVYVSALEHSVPPIPDAPSAEEVGRALALIEEGVADFPFTDAASRANAFSALLTPVVRPVIRGHTPLFLFDAPSQGTGKSTLAELVGLITVGEGVGMLPEPEDDAEWRKRLTAVFREGHSVAVLDDLKRRLDSPVLAMAITAEVWRDRLLGTNSTVGISNRITLIATGNNLRLGGDLPRRSVWVRLDALTAQPWRRTFRHPDIMAWVREHRGELLWAVLVLARAWWAAGCPEAQIPALAGFQEWAAIVGGILAHAGVSGFLGNLDRMYTEVDEGAPQFERFLSAWHEVYGSTPMRAAQIAEDIRLGTSPLRDALPDALAEFVDEKGKGKLAHRLGNLLRRKVDVRHGSECIRVERAGSDDHLQVGMWHVVRDDQGPDAVAAPPPAPETPIPQKDLPAVVEPAAEGGDDGRRTWVLGMGESLDWPAVSIGCGETLAAGETHWRTFYRKADDDQIARACNALQALDAQEPPRR